MFTFVDRSRQVRIQGRRVPRTLVTRVLYPATGPASAPERRGAPAQTARAPYPLIVFGHGFTLLPTTYRRLAHAWAQAGFVVAAPAFPLENANAPGGPDERDLANQPGDVSFVITQMLAQSSAAGAPLSGLIAPGAIGVSGHSDGGTTASAVSCAGGYRDRRVVAAAMLSGAWAPDPGGCRGPAVLAVQGTADTINPPRSTYSFFASAGRPKFLLKLFGAPHEAPYTVQQPYLGVVQRVTTEFFDQYLTHRPGALDQMARDGQLRRVAGLTARP